MNHSTYDKLLSPLQIGPVRVRNRTVFTAHRTNFGWGDPGGTGERQIAYYQRRAAGGVGLIVIEPLVVLPSPSADGSYYLDYMRERYGRLAAAVHEHGARIFQQIVCGGALRRSDGTDYSPLLSFNGMTTPEGEASHRMSPQEIEETINGFVKIARLVVESGIDGVELHATHGVLLQQSYSPWGNSRNDEWGEPLRYIRAVIERTRAAIGSNAVLGLRICVDDFLSAEEGGVGTERLLQIAQALAAEGKLDYINHSEGSKTEHYARSVGSWRHPHGEFLPITARLKAAVGAAMPVIGVGRIVNPDLAEQALQSGACDLVALTRAQIADPDLVSKVKSGNAGRIRRCVGANQGCVDRTLADLPITCLLNPEVGREQVLGELTPAATAKRVLVIGGGPAGLKAAEIAARRGHRVTLVESDAHLGGRFHTAAKLPPASEFNESIRWLERELAHLGVEIFTNTLADLGFVQKLAPEVIVLATGALPRPDLAFGSNSDGSIHILSADEAMDADLADMDVLVIDGLGDPEAVFAAEQLARGGARVTIVAPRPVVGAQIGITHLAETPRVLAELGCKLQPNWNAVKVEQGHVYLGSMLDGEQQRRPFDWIVASVPSTPRLDLHPLLEQAGFEVLLVGDAKAPRTAMQAFREGDAVGRQI